MKIVHQKYNNDCSVAVVSMMIDIPYKDVLAIAIENGFVPDNDKGLYADDLLNWCGYECDWADGFYSTNDSDDVRMIITPSRFKDGNFHIIGYHHGKVYDPNWVNKINLKRAVRSATHTGYNIRPKEDD